MLHYAPLDARSKPRPEYIMMDQSEQPRTAQAVLLDIPALGGKVWVVNTHLSHKPWAAEHRRQARQLLDWIQDFASGLPVLLCGDFNCPMHLLGGAYRVITSDSRYGRWCDLFLEQECVPPDTSTIPSSIYRERFASGERHEAGFGLQRASSWRSLASLRMMSMRIDYILALRPSGMLGRHENDERGLRTPRYVGVTRCVVVNSSKEAVLASDHCGVVAELVLGGLDKAS